MEWDDVCIQGAEILCGIDCGSFWALEKLDNFLTLLHDGYYQKASFQFGGSYTTLTDWNPTVDPNDHGTLWQHGCELNGLVCETIQSVVNKQLNGSDFSFTVQMNDGFGGLLTIGTQSEFDFTVHRNGMNFLVMSMPPYAP